MTVMSSSPALGWARQWRRANGLYRVRVLDPAERALATRLLGEDGMPAECFPKAEGRLEDDNDARIIAQMIAAGRTLLLNSNLVMVRDQALQDWFDAHHNEWLGVQAHKRVQHVDPLFCRWWREKVGMDVLTPNLTGDILARRREPAARGGTQMLRERPPGTGTRTRQEVRAASAGTPATVSEHPRADRASTPRTVSTHERGRSRTLAHAGKRSRDSARYDEPSGGRTQSGRLPR